MRAGDDERADDREHHAQRKGREGGSGARSGDRRARHEQGGVQGEEEASAVPGELDLRAVVGVGELVVGEGGGRGRHDDESISLLWAV